MRAWPGRAVPHILFAAVPAAFAGCDGDGATAPTVESVRGNYTATTFTTMEGAVTTNWLARGASLQITLAADGMTSGRLFVPGGAEDGSDFDADLTGTWSLTGDVVRFSHEADTFVRDMAFRVRGARLEGEETFDEVRIRVVLQKQ